MLPPLEEREGYGTLFTTEQEYIDWLKFRAEHMKKYAAAAGFAVYEPRDHSPR